MSKHLFFRENPLERQGVVALPQMKSDDVS